MKLVLDKQSAALGRKAHHDKLTTVVRRHLAKRNDQERSQNRQDTSRLLQRAKKASGTVWEDDAK